MPALKLGELLVEMRAIDRFQLKTALGLQQRTRSPLGRIVVDQWFCSGKNVLLALSRQSGLPLVELDAQLPTASVAQLLPRKVAFALKAIPFAVESGARQRLRIAVSAPGRSVDVPGLQSELEYATGRDVKLFLAWDDSLERALESCYPDARKPGTPEVLVAGWSGEKTQALLDALMGEGLSARAVRGLAALESTPEQVLVCPTPFLLSLSSFRRAPRASLVLWVDSAERARRELASAGAHGFLVEGRDPAALARAVGRICHELGEDHGSRDFEEPKRQLTDVPGR